MPKTRTTKKTEADLANEALDAAMTDSDKAYWTAAGADEIATKGDTGTWKSWYC